MREKSEAMDPEDARILGKLSKKFAHSYDFFANAMSGTLARNKCDERRRVNQVAGGRRMNQKLEQGMKHEERSGQTNPRPQLLSRQTVPAQRAAARWDHQHHHRCRRRRHHHHQQQQQQQEEDDISGEEGMSADSQQWESPTWLHRGRKGRL